MSTERKLARHAGMGCLRGLALQLVAVIVVVPSTVVLLGVTLALAQDRRFGPFVAFAVAMVGMGLLVGGLGGAVFAWNQARLRRLDPGFAAAGRIAGAMFMQNGRQWRGEAHGRRVDAYLFRGPSLEIFVEGSPRSRMGIGVPGLLSGIAARAMGREPLDALDPAYRQVEVYAAEPGWARGVLADPRAREVVPRLFAEGPEGGIRVVQVLPDAVMLRVAHVALGQLEPVAVTAWLADLASLAAACEAVAPAEVLASSPTESMSRTARGRLAARISCAIFLVFGVLMVVLTIAAFVAAFAFG